MPWIAYRRLLCPGQHRVTVGETLTRCPFHGQAARRSGPLWLFYSGRSSCQQPCRLHRNPTSASNRKVSVVLHLKEVRAAEVNNSCVGILCVGSSGVASLIFSIRGVQSTTLGAAMSDATWVQLAIRLGVKLTNVLICTGTLPLLAGFPYRAFCCRYCLDCAESVGDIDNYCIHLENLKVL